MLRYENECVDCGRPCLGRTCQYRNVPHIYCDGCGGEESEMFAYDGEDYCRDCIIDKLLEDGVIEKKDV